MPMQSLHESPVPSVPQEPLIAAGSAQSGVGPRMIQELNGPAGPEPTRYGDWERRGRCIDF
jgi:hypothetical protein